MNAIRWQRNTDRDRVGRAGYFVGSELVLVAIVLVILCCTVTQLIASGSSATGELASLATACSERPVNRLSATNDGRHLWVARRGREVQLLDRFNGRIVDGRGWCGSQLSDVSHSDSGSTSFLLGVDGSALLHNSGHERFLENLFPPDYAGAELIRDGCVSSDGSLALAITNLGTVFVLSSTEPESPTLTYKLPVMPQARCSRLDHAGERLFVAGQDGTSHIVAARTGERLGEPLNVEAACLAAAWSHDGSSLALMLGEERLALWDIARNSLRALRAVASRCTVSALAVSRDDRWGAVAGSHSHVTLWDTASDAVYKLSGHAGLVQSLAFAPQSDALFSGSLDGTVREWSLSTFVAVRCLEGK